MTILSKSKSLEKHFMDVQSKQDRNSVICLAYLEDGYSQIEIANYLGLSKSAVSLIRHLAKLGTDGFSLVLFGTKVSDSESVLQEVYY
jgi:DNA-binding CsgD family transcriptional regulator